MPISSETTPNGAPDTKSDVRKLSTDAPSNSDDPTSASTKGFTFDTAFDAFLTELEWTKDNQEPNTAGSRLIAFHDLQRRAAEDGFSLTALPLSKLRASIRQGYFCLKTGNMVEVDGSMSLSDYVAREKQAVGKTGKFQTLSIFWTRPQKRDLGDVLAQIVEPLKPGSTPKPDGKVDFARELTSETFESTLKGLQSIGMDKSSKGGVQYEMSWNQWAKVVEANELLCAFQVDVDQTRRLQETKLASFIGSDSEQAAGPAGNQPDAANANKTSGDILATSGNGNKPDHSGTEDKPATDVKPGDSHVTSMSNNDLIMPIARSTRQVFMTRHESAFGSAQKADEGPSDIHAGLFWSNAKSISVTKVSMVKNSVQAWSTESGMSSKSISAGLSFPLGKKITVGSKFGFEREHSSEYKGELMSDKQAFTAVHEVPTVQVNLNESTVLLSPDAESDIKRLRKERSFADLLIFFDKYGSVVFQNTTLGGRLYYSQLATSEEIGHSEKNAENFKKSVTASLGIPQTVEVKTGYNSTKSESTASGGSEVEKMDNIIWSGIGGNPGLVVDPPKWRDSLNEYGTWRPIRYENAIRIDEFIGRLPGFTDVPVVFASILATGVLDQAAINFPSAGLQRAPAPQSATAASPKPLVPPSLGLGIDARSGGLKGGLSTSKPMTPVPSRLAPEGFSWAVLATDRDVRKEIIANFQSTLNASVNLPVTPTFLDDVEVDSSIFTIVLRWTSLTLKTLWQEAAEANSKPTTKSATDDLGDFFIRSLTSRAWLIGLWKIEKSEKMCEKDFQNLRHGIKQRFSEPQQMEEGCDYITKVTGSGTEATRVIASFKLYASDATKNNEIAVTNDWISPINAFNLISQRRRLSSINVLIVSGEIEAYNGSTPPKLDERALMQTQEARVSIQFLKAKGQTASIAQQKLKISTDASLFDQEATFDATIFDDLNKAEWALTEKEIAGSST